MVHGKSASMSLILFIQSRRVVLSLASVMSACIIILPTSSMSDTPQATPDVISTAEPSSMEQDTIIIHGTGMPITQDPGRGDSMSTTIRGRAGLSTPAGVSRTDGLYARQEPNVQDGGDRQKITRCTIQLRSRFIGKDPIRHITGQCNTRRWQKRRTMEDERPAYSVRQLSTILEEQV